MQLNLRSQRLIQQTILDAVQLNIGFNNIGGATVLDFGIEKPGGIEAGVRLAEICMSGLADVSVQFNDSRPPLPNILVRTDHPLEACIGSQYAGWEFKHDDFFAMVSGPIRCLRRKKEQIILDAKVEEDSQRGVAILETRRMPPADAIRAMAEECDIEPDQLAICVAPTASLAGSTQIVARSIETAIHKLHELEFEIDRVVAGSGKATLPPSGQDDMVALGWTNDSILYGSQVTLWLNANQGLIDEFGPQVPSCSSADFGKPFMKLFQQYDCDFYKMDRMLFSPAEVTLIDRNSGYHRTFGETRFDIIDSSIG